MKKILFLLLLLPTLLRAQSPRYWDLSSMRIPNTAPVGYYASYTVPTTSVLGGSSLTNYPVLINLTISQLATTANGGHTINANGYDITFSTDSSGNFPLNWDVEQWSPTTGNIQVWIRFPTLSNAVSNVIYIHTGNAAFTTYQGNRPATWDANYVGVYHMSETITGASQTIHDVTSNGNNMTTFGSWSSGQQATGQIGPSLQFTGASDYASFPLQTYSSASTYSIEAWYNPTNVTGSVAMGWSGGTVEGSNWTTGAFQIYNTTPGVILTDGTSSTANTWVYLAWTQNGTAMTMYHNGASSGTSTSGGVLNLNYVNAYQSTISPTTTYDEIRISNITRPAGYFATMYSNTHAPSSFGTVGTWFLN